MGDTDRRSRLEMKMSVLEALLHSPQVQTQVQYHANLNWARLKQLLEKLEQSGLIERVSHVNENYGVLWKITGKGYEAVKAWMKLTLLMTGREGERR